MAKKQQDTKKPRYKYFCHKCQEVFDSSELTYMCKCGGNALTITDFVNPMSGYFVGGVRV